MMTGRDTLQRTGHVGRRSRGRGNTCWPLLLAKPGCILIVRNTHFTIEKKKERRRMALVMFSVATPLIAIYLLFLVFRRGNLSDRLCVCVVISNM